MVGAVVIVAYLGAILGRCKGSGWCHDWISGFDFYKGGAWCYGWVLCRLGVWVLFWLLSGMC